MNWADFGAGAAAGIITMLGVSAGAGLWVFKHPQVMVRRIIRGRLG